jgi:ketosteroid isomerase-like protein
MPSAPILTNAAALTSAEYLSDCIKNAFGSIKSGRFVDLAELEHLYSVDVCFEDPAHAIQGRIALMNYYRKLLQGLDSCQFRFHRSVVNGTDLFLSWTVTFTHPRLNGGQLVRVEGASYLRTRHGRIYYHRDYFDLGALLYENLPLLGRLILRIKSGLGA